MTPIEKVLIKYLKKINDWLTIKIRQYEIFEPDSHVEFYNGESNIKIHLILKMK